MSKWTDEVFREIERMARDGDPEAMDLFVQWSMYRGSTRNPPYKAPGWDATLRLQRLGDVTIAERIGIGMEGHGMAHCPSHEDRSKSLSWKWDNGKLLLHCFAGCTWEQIREVVR